MQSAREMAEEAVVCHQEGNMRGFVALREEIRLMGYDHRTVDRYLVEAGLPVSELYPSGVLECEQPLAAPAVY